MSTHTTENNRHPRGGNVTTDVKIKTTVVPDHCPNCQDPGDGSTYRVDTGCTALNCPGYRFDCCGTGCDAGRAGGRCDGALVAEVQRLRAAIRQAITLSENVSAARAEEVLYAALGVDPLVGPLPTPRDF
jgi:hypothetical protein